MTNKIKIDALLASDNDMKKTPTVQKEMFAMVVNSQKNQSGLQEEKKAHT